jgi:hypothetical protein
VNNQTHDEVIFTIPGGLADPAARGITPGEYRGFINTTIAALHGLANTTLEKAAIRITRAEHPEAFLGNNSAMEIYADGTPLLAKRLITYR